MPQYGHWNITYTILNYGNMTGYVFTKHSQALTYPFPLRRTPVVYPESKLVYHPDHLIVERVWCMYHGKFGFTNQQLPDRWFYAPFGYLTDFQFFMITRGFAMLHNEIYNTVQEAYWPTAFDPFQLRDAYELNKVLKKIKGLYYHCMKNAKVTVDI